jgi:hypothetical protein
VEEALMSKGSAFADALKATTGQEAFESILDQAAASQASSRSAGSAAFKQALRLSPGVAAFEAAVKRAAGPEALAAALEAVGSSSVEDAFKLDGAAFEKVAATSKTDQARARSRSGRPLGWTCLRSPSK